MSARQPARARSAAPHGAAPVGRRTRPTGTGVSIAAAVLLAVPLAVVLWLLALLEDRARRRCGLPTLAPCCGQCTC